MDPNKKKIEKQTSGHFIPKAKKLGWLKTTKIFPENLITVEVKLGDVNEEDLFLSFRGLLIFGRILGIIPICGVFSKSYRNLQTNLLSVPGITSGICIILLTLNLCLAITNALHEEKKSILSIANSIKLPLFSSGSLLIYVYFLIRRRHFIKIFKLWASVSQTLRFTEKDKNLKMTIVLISVIMFTSAFIENAILHMEYFEVFDDINGHNARFGKEQGNVDVLQMYYWRSHSYWNRFLGYHPILALMAFFSYQFILFGWEYIHVMSALFFRALYYQFKSLCKVAKENLPMEPTLLDYMNDINPSDGDRRDNWDQLAQDHDALCEVLHVMNDSFSPIAFVSYAFNIFFFCMQLLYSLNPDAVNHSIVHSIDAPWSFVHIILRIFLFSLFASKINEYAHKIRDVMARCPLELYNKRITKLDKKVNFGPQLGITGLDCFVITKPFMLSIVNVVFSVEIILLQGLASDQQQKQDQNQCQGSPSPDN